MSGGDNPVTDALSRAAVNTLHVARPQAVDFKAMAKAQAEDPELRSLQASPSSTLQFATIPQLTSPSSLICDTSTGVPRPFVPADFRRTVFESLHSLSHPGTTAMQRLIADRFVWPAMNADVKTWEWSCLQCQRSKVQRHTATPLSTFATPDTQFDRIHIDIVGPLPPSCGYSYLLMCIDCFTRWPEAFPMADITAETMALTFASGWIARFGVPSTISTDCGRQFVSQLWILLMQLLGCNHLRTPPTIRSQTESSKDSIGNSRHPSNPIHPQSTGLSHFHSSSSVSPLPSKMTCGVVPLNRCMAPLFDCQLNSSSRVLPTLALGGRPNISLENFNRTLSINKV